MILLDYIKIKNKQENLVEEWCSYINKDLHRLGKVCWSFYGGSGCLDIILWHLILVFLFIYHPSVCLKPWLLTIGLLFVLYWTVNNAQKHCIISFPQHNHMGKLCLFYFFFFTYRESVFAILSCISTVLTQTAEKQPEPFKVDLVEGGESTGRCHGEINLPPQTAWKLTNVLTSHTETGLLTDLCLSLCWFLSLSEHVPLSASVCAWQALAQARGANTPSLKRKVKAHLFVLCLSLTHHLALLRALFEALIHSCSSV